ncbi:MAG: SPOR domain-containing protein [Treponema sp.]|jgi:rare lipoprotein A|nr:SPOR domain-containing protein [Treponema sp.]
MKKAVIVLILSAVIVLPAAAQTIEGNGTWYSTAEKNLSASHADLPLGTRIRITNLDNNRTVIVTITGRIPEDPERLIDVSQAAARNIGMKDSGTTRVKVEVLTLGKAPDGESPASPEKSGAAEMPPPEPEAEKAAVPESLPEPSVDSIVDVPGFPEPETALRPEPSPVPEKTENRAEALPAIVVEPPVVNIPPAQYQLSITIEGLGTIEKSGVLESGKETTIRVQAPEAAPKAPPAPPPPLVVPPQPPVRPPAAVVTRLPSAHDGKLYRIQVGSFSSVSAVVRARERVINAGFNAYYERYEEMYRLVLIHVPSADIPLIAEKLGNAGFRELWARVE